MTPDLRGGRWCGWWRQGLHEGHEVLGLEVLEGAVTGTGQDEGGVFVLRGKVSPEGTASLTKHYTLPLLPGPPTRSYQGQWNGRVIRGSWQDDRAPERQGPFLLWPSREAPAEPSPGHGDQDLRALLGGGPA